jgi:predicted nucleotidyltransferase
MVALSTLDQRTPTADAPVLKEAVRRLAGLYSPERIYLFGSVARGDAGPDSDYDILIVVPDNSPQDHLQSGIGRRAIRDLGLAKDIFVCRSGDFRKQLHLKASFPSTVAREGKVLYGL